MPIHCISFLFLFTLVHIHLYRCQISYYSSLLHAPHTCGVVVCVNSPASNKTFPMNHLGYICSDLYFGCFVVCHYCPFNVSICREYLYYMATLNMVYEYRNVHVITVANTEAPLIYVVQKWVKSNYNTQLSLVFISSISPLSQHYQKHGTLGVVISQCFWSSQWW